MKQTALYTVMTRAVRKAAGTIRRDFGELEKLQVSKKGTRDYVTQTDLRAEKILRDELGKARPDFGFLLEEGGEIEGRDKAHRWIIDPLDGTANFIHAMPHVCVSVGLEQRRGDSSEIIAGIIYDPLRDEMFWAEKGEGAYMNDHRINVSGRRKLEEALLSTHSPKQDFGGCSAYHFMQAVCPHAHATRTMGATALDLAYIAAGRIDGGWYPFYKAWDVAAGLLLIKEARGVVTALSGDRAPSLEEGGGLLAGNSAIHAALWQRFAPLLAAKHSG